MNPWLCNLLFNNSGGSSLPVTGQTFYASLKTSLVPEVGTGAPTWSRATAAWRFNDMGLLRQIPSGCADFGGARLVRNFIRNSALDNAVWTNTGLTVTAGQTDYLGGTSAFLLMETAATSNHDIRDDGVSPGAGLAMMISCVVKANGRDQVRILDNAYNAISATFNLSTVTSVSTVGTSTITDLGGGYYKCVAKTTGSISNNPFFPRIYLFNGTTSYAGDITKGVILSHVQVSSVTGYDASYVPEYVSVGVLSAPYHGTGVDGSKYFATDWQGAPIPVANLTRLRKEQSATNAILYSRDLSKKAWGCPASSGIDPELLTNGNFDDSTNWVRSGAAYWSVSGGVLNLNATDSSLSYYDNSQPYAALVTGKQYIVEFDYVHISGTAPTITLRGTDAKALGNSTGRKVVTVTCGASTGYGIRIQTFASAVATIDNITVKEAPIQCALTATGLDGIANTATTLTATAADAIILQPTSGIASAARCASAYVKRVSGTGTISFTQDGGSTWTDITSQLSSSTYSRVQITATLANPSVGFKISTSGDAIAVDCVQNEAGSVATSPIVTTSTTVNRNADSLTYQTASNWSDTAGTAYILAKPVVYSGGAVGSATNGLLLSASNSGATAYDGTNAANGPTGTPGETEKLALAWGSSTMSVASSGAVGASGTYDGAMGLSSIGVGVGASGYFGDVAIYDYKMTDAELQAITT